MKSSTYGFIKYILVQCFLSSSCHGVMESTIKGRVLQKLNYWGGGVWILLRPLVSHDNFYMLKFFTSVNLLKCYPIQCYSLYGLGMFTLFNEYGQEFLWDYISQNLHESIFDYYYSLWFISCVAFPIHNKILRVIFIRLWLVSGLFTTFVAFVSPIFFHFWTYLLF